MIDYLIIDWVICFIIMDIFTNLVITSYTALNFIIINIDDKDLENLSRVSKTIRQTIIHVFEWNKRIKYHDFNLFKKECFKKQIGYKIINKQYIKIISFHSLKELFENSVQIGDMVDVYIPIFFVDITNEVVDITENVTIPTFTDVKSHLIIKSKGKRKLYSIYKINTN